MHCDWALIVSAVIVVINRNGSKDYKWLIITEAVITFTDRVSFLIILDGKTLFKLPSESEERHEDEKHSASD